MQKLFLDLHAILFSLLSEFSAKNSWSTAKKCMEGSLLVYKIREENNRREEERENGIFILFYFYFQKSDIDFVIAIDFCLDLS